MGGHSRPNEQRLTAGHVSADGHTHIHMHLDELYFAGSEGVISSVSNTTQDLVFRNPSGSNKYLEIIQLKITTSTDYEASKYYNVTYPETSGAPDGTKIIPFNASDRSVSATFEAQHTPAGDSTNLVDETTADRQIPTGVSGGTKQNPSTFDLVGVTTVINPGETVLFRTELSTTGNDIAYLVVTAEYEMGRDIT